MDQPTENWLPVPGWEGLYEVSDQGRVRSLDRIDDVGRLRRGRVLSNKRNAAGYPRVALSLHGVKHDRLVHRLVLEAFVGPCPDGMEGCHNDGDPSNPELRNLRWDTAGENQRDSVGHGTHWSASKTHCPSGHPLVDGNLAEWALRQGHRWCLTCDRERYRARRQRQEIRKAPDSPS